MNKWSRGSLMPLKKPSGIFPGSFFVAYEYDYSAVF